MLITKYKSTNIKYFRQTHLGKSKSKLMPTISTISESNLVKEILWMFIAPTTCKTFIVDKVESTVLVADGVSINTLSQVIYLTPYS